MIKPLNTLWFLIVVGIVLSLSVIVIPSKGIDVLGFSIHMPSFSDLLTKDTTEYADISDLVETIDNIDSLPDITEMLAIDSVQQDLLNTKDTIKANADELAKLIHCIEFPNGDKSNLLPFFEKLNALGQNGSSIRIMHYGDSQLEGDRITSYIRNKLQSKYGGSGPGLLPALQPYESYFSINQSNEGLWNRYAVFGRIDPAVEGERYGPLAAFSRYAPIADSLWIDSAHYQASVIFDESKLSYTSVRDFQKIQLLYGNAKSEVTIQLFVDDVLVKTDKLKANTSFATYKFQLAAPSRNLKITFSGSDSPDIYGISLEGLKGVSMDNIGMRGSSGTIFRKMNYGHLQKAYNALDVQLFIMQFGGNVMPYIKDTAAAVNYGKWFYSQLTTLKSLRPNASLIVIGPSDMSYKEGENYVTYPYLEVVRDELRKATFKAGFAYWDMYEAMGGHNSMPSWVRSEPALAGSDYTHFTPRGAKLIANMFYNALMIESIKK